jgi:hypothetical protein
MAAATDDHDVVRALEIAARREHPRLRMRAREPEFEQSPRHGRILARY